VWWLRPIAAVTMGAMLFVTPFVGGHYFIDVFAGIVIAIGAIAAARWTSKRVLARSVQSELTAAPAAALSISPAQPAPH
jgi:membrane-associated phospholipid phosphatase